MNNAIEPALVELPNGTKEWRNADGQLHREDGPAVIQADGTKEWYSHGLRHREDGPAVEWANGTKEWWINGQRHRGDGPAIEYADGSKEWHREGELHRGDGPAIAHTDGTELWCLDGRRLFAKEVTELKAKLARQKGRGGPAPRRTAPALPAP